MAYVELKHLVDREDNTHVEFSALCDGTMYHVACLVKKEAFKHIMQGFVDIWLTHYGVLEIVVVDQGAEFESTFAHECEESGIDIRITGSHAGWQQGFLERRGGLLSEMWNKRVCKFRIPQRERD